MTTKNCIMLLGIIFIGLVSCNENSKKETKVVNKSPIVVVTKEEILVDRNIDPNGKIGLISVTTTKSELDELYGNENISETIVFSYEGIDVKGSQVSFENNNDNFSIEWNEDNLTPKTIRIENKNSNWKTKDGIGIGSTISEVEKANGIPFTIYGYEIDAYLAGTIKNWNSGNLQGLNLQFKMTKDLPTEEYMKIMGIGGILSNNALLEKANLQVEKISIEFQ